MGWTPFDRDQRRAKDENFKKNFKGMAEKYLKDNKGLVAVALG